MRNTTPCEGDSLRQVVMQKCVYFATAAQKTAIAIAHFVQNIWKSLLDQIFAINYQKIYEWGCPLCQNCVAVITKIWSQLSSTISTFFASLHNPFILGFGCGAVVSLLLICGALAYFYVGTAAPVAPH